MSYKDELIWLKGKKVAFCEPDETLFAEVKAFLGHYGLDVIGLNSIESMLADLESRRYSTHRIYMAVFVTAELAKDLETSWLDVIRVNPGVAQTPLVLMASESERKSVQSFIEKGYFKFCMDHPVPASQMLRVLRRLNRWKALRGDLTPDAILES
ncbi:MAG: hypothetical protein U9R28_05835 [Pseudomonadota bacterium]|nr:hypothetical protein [Pseudomonadota bacterium]